MASFRGVLTVAMVLLKPTNYICCSVCMMVRSKEIATMFINIESVMFSCV